MDQRHHDDGAEARGQKMNNNKVVEVDGSGGNMAENSHQHIVVAREDFNFVPAT